MKNSMRKDNLSMHKPHGLLESEKGLSKALKRDAKADAGVKANLKSAMQHLKSQHKESP